MHNHVDTIIGTTGGTLLTIITLPSFNDASQTIILAILGAIVSFCTSLILKKIRKHYTKESKKDI